MNGSKSAARGEYAKLSDKLRAEGCSGLYGSMAYHDYLNAAYSYRAAAEKKLHYESKLVSVKSELEEKQQLLNEITGNIAENRERRKFLYDSEINKVKLEWSEQNEAYNDSIDEEIDAIKQNADEQIQKLRDDYIQRSAVLDKELRPLYEQVEKYENEIEELMDKETMFDDFSATEIPIENTEVLQFLVRARKKHLLSRFQREVMGRACDRVIGVRKDFRLFDDVLNEERKFAASKRYRELKEGKVTEEVRFKAATIASAAVVLLCALLLLPMLTTDSPAVSRVVEVVLMMLSCCGLAVNAVSFVVLRMFFGEIPEYKRNNVLLAAAFSGMLFGFGVWFMLFRAGLGIGFVPAIFSLVCTFFLLRKSVVSFVGLDTLNRFEVFRDFTRREIFRDMTAKKKGRYNLQMYCYLNHDAVIDYMSMNYRDNVTLQVANKLELAQNSLKVAKKRLAEHKEELRRLKEMKTELKQNISRVREERDEAVRLAEEKRELNTPNFDELLPSYVSEELERLDDEYAKLEENRTKLAAQTADADNLFSQTEIRSLAAADKYKTVGEMLREWNSTPMPRTTDYMLSELFCFESSDSINIIKHNLKPFVFRYSVGRRTDNPAKYLKQVMYRCIKGLVKINPTALMQINIVDAVSDPNILKEYEELGYFTHEGVITGISSADEFELRLFESRKSYKAFRALFNSQCYDIRDYLNDNKERLTEDMDRSLASANRLRDNEDEPYVYQIMMYVVPREYDDTDFAPPEELVRAMKNDTCLGMGIIPFFFVDCDSVHESWQEVVSLCRWSCSIGKKGSK